MWVGDHVFAYFLRLPWSVWSFWRHHTLNRIRPCITTSLGQQISERQNINEIALHTIKMHCKIPLSTWKVLSSDRLLVYTALSKKSTRCSYRIKRRHTHLPQWQQGWACNCKTFIDIPQDFRCMKTEHSILREHEENTVCCLYVWKLPVQQVQVPDEKLVVPWTTGHTNIKMMQCMAQAGWANVKWVCQKDHGILQYLY